MVPVIKKTPLAKWTNAMRKVLLYALLKYSNRRFANLSNDKARWKKVLSKFNLKSGLEYTRDMLTTQCVQMKKTWDTLRNTPTLADLEWTQEESLQEHWKPSMHMTLRIQRHYNLLMLHYLSMRRSWSLLEVRLLAHLSDPLFR